MAVSTFFTLLTIMHVGFLMAAVTVMWRLMVFLFRFMTGIAGRFCMHAFQAEVGFGVVECRWVKQDYFCISAFMLGVTVLAVSFNRSGQTPMESGFFINVIEYVFMVMALHAKFALSGLVRGVVALTTILFIFLMCLYYRARHQQGSQGICMDGMKSAHYCYGKYQPGKGV